MQREKNPLVRGYLGIGMKWGCMCLFEARDGRRVIACSCNYRRDRKEGYGGVSFYVYR